MLVGDLLKKLFMCKIEIIDENLKQLACGRWDSEDIAFYSHYEIEYISIVPDYPGCNGVISIRVNS